MKILIDILHPAHVHFYRKFIAIMQLKGHEVLVTARKKDCTIELLNEYGIKHQVISELKGGKVHLAFELLSRTYKLYKFAKKHDVDVLTGSMGASTAIVGKALGKPVIVFYNNECATLTNWYAYPLATAVATPASYMKKVKGKHVTYNGCNELAYLRDFVPNREVALKLGLEEPFFLVRFVSWQASHDIYKKGLGTEEKKVLVKELEKIGRVVISSEKELPKSLEKYKLKIEAKDMHDVLAKARLYIGEGATMASEAACLGTGAAYINELQFGYLQDLESFGLVKNFKRLNIAQILEMAKVSKEVYTKRKDVMLKQREDVTKWMVEYFDSFSKHVGKEAKQHDLNAG